MAPVERGGRSPKNKGDAYERAVVRYLQERGIHVTRAKRGNPTGDVLGIDGLTIECKNQRSYDIAGWIKQMQASKELSESRLGVVIAKRRGTTDVSQHYAILTVEDLVTLLGEAGYVGF